MAEDPLLAPDLPIRETVRADTKAELPVQAVDIRATTLVLPEQDTRVTTPVLPELAIREIIPDLLEQDTRATTLVLPVALAISHDKVVTNHVRVAHPVGSDPKAEDQVVHLSTVLVVLRNPKVVQISTH